MADATFVESPEVAVAGTNIGFHDYIHRTIDGVSSAVDLTGKTVRASIRRVSRPNTVINAALEDLSVTVGSAPTQGEVDWTVLGAASASLEELCPTDPSRTTMFHVQYYVVQEDYYPQMHYFHARRATD